MIPPGRVFPACMIGHSHCQFATRLRPGQGAPSWKQGLVAPDGEPSLRLLEAIVATNRDLLERLYRPWRLHRAPRRFAPVPA
jgi:hypothetical protein